MAWPHTNTDSRRVCAARKPNGERSEEAEEKRDTEAVAQFAP